MTSFHVLKTAINDSGNHYDDDDGGGDDGGDDIAGAVDAYADLEEPLGGCGGASLSFT